MLNVAPDLVEIAMARGKFVCSTCNANTYAIIASKPLNSPLFIIHDGAGLLVAHVARMRTAPLLFVKMKRIA